MTAPKSSNDRRICTRHPAHLAVTLQPVDAQRQPVGREFDAASVDLSQSGLCCISDRPLTAEFVIVRILAANSEDELLLFAQRIRCERNSTMFELALQFLEKLPADEPESQAVQTT